MNRIRIGLFTCTSLIFFNACITTKLANEAPREVKINQKNSESNYGLNLVDMDFNIHPQDDFYNFVNGNWIRNTQIPPVLGGVDVSDIITEKVEKECAQILDSIVSSNHVLGSESDKIKNLYQSFIDIDRRNEQGLIPIQNEINQITAINTWTDLQKYLTAATRFGNNPFYEWSVGRDFKNTKQNIVHLNGPKLGLGREYFQKLDEDNLAVLERYQIYVSNLLRVLGEEKPEQTAKNIVYFEKQLASYLLTQEQRRNANLSYNIIKNTELGDLVKGIDLNKYLVDAGVKTDQVIIKEINYYKNLDKLLTDKNLNLIKDYLKYKLLSKNANYLTMETEQIDFDFYLKFLEGQEIQSTVETKVFNLIDDVLGEAFGKLYVEKYFPSENKNQIELYVKYLKKSFNNHIDQLDWMSNETKGKAKEKLAKIKIEIGYPNQWKDYSKLTIESPQNGATLYTNIQHFLAWQYDNNLVKIGKPISESEWLVTPQYVSAYYRPDANEIVFAAALLQPPYFNSQADPAVNFGGIGATIGHEISHAFDDAGSRFDGDGNLINWWTEEDRIKFDEKVTLLANQFNQYEPVKGNFINGKFTSGENIGDLGGIAVAYDALQMYLNDFGNPGLIDGFTQDQRFFISWATTFKEKATDQYLQNKIKTDPHAPGYFRVIGPLINQDNFIKAFDIKPGDKMYKKPEERIKIW